MDGARRGGGYERDAKMKLVKRERTENEQQGFIKDNGARTI